MPRRLAKTTPAGTYGAPHLVASITSCKYHLQHLTACQLTSLQVQKGLAFSACSWHCTGAGTVELTGACANVNRLITRSSESSYELPDLTLPPANKHKLPLLVAKCYVFFQSFVLQVWSDEQERQWMVKCARWTRPYTTSSACPCTIKCQ